MKGRGERNAGWYVDKLFHLFRDTERAEIDKVLAMFARNEELRIEGYGWKRVKVRCSNTVSCGWEGKRLWGMEMFNKPCPRCKFRSKGGHTSLFCPPHAEKE